MSTCHLSLFSLLVLPVGQVEELVAQQEFDEALSLVPVISDRRYQSLKEIKINEIRAKHGYHLFQKVRAP